MNELIPFSYGQFQTKEAVYLPQGMVVTVTTLDGSIPLTVRGKTDWLKRYRFPRKAAADFLYPGHPKGQKYIDKIIERNPHLKALAVTVILTATHEYKQRGHIPVTVTGICPSARTIEYETETYDIFGLYQIAIESNAPRKKEFLKNFPAWLVALQEGRIRPLPPRARRKLIALEGLKELECVRYGERVEARERLAEAAGMSGKTHYRTEKLSPEHRYTKGWARYIIRRYLPTWIKIEELLQEGKWQQKDIAKQLGVSPSMVSQYVNIYSKKVGELLAYGA